MSVSLDDNEFVCIFRSHLTKPNKCSFMTFNSKSDEKIIAKTDYRRHSAMACVDGKKVLPLAEDL